LNKDLVLFGELAVRQPAIYWSANLPFPGQRPKFPETVGDDEFPDNLIVG
jgi:hypothetical protein